MSLDLDDRQRAMLQEMGVHVWWPPAVPALAPEPAPAAAPAVQAPAAQSLPPAASEAPAVADEIAHLALSAVSVSGRAPAPAPVAGGQDIAAMDWDTLCARVAACQDCPLSVGRRAPVWPSQAPPARADWLVVGDPPEEAEERDGQAFADQSGQLLDNMLRAVGVRRQSAHDAPDLASGAGLAYLTNVAKCRPASPRVPSGADLAACERYLQREIARVQPKVILALGRFALQTLLREHFAEHGTAPLGKLRGQVYRYQGIPVIVSYSPATLLRTPADKARAWADLCLALEAAGRAAG